MRALILAYSSRVIIENRGYFPGRGAGYRFRILAAEFHDEVRTHVVGRFEGFADGKVESVGVEWFHAGIIPAFLFYRNIPGIF